MQGLVQEACRIPRKQRLDSQCSGSPSIRIIKAMSGTSYFTYQGRKLSDIYDEAYDER